ncbi:hypothetical protein SFRURICE_002533, partial [Spodoptera frugiperda]
WYRVNKDRLCPELIKKFVQLYPDEETKEFLSASIDKSSWVWTQIWYLLAKAVLRHFWSVTDINGDLLLKKSIGPTTYHKDEFKTENIDIDELNPDQKMIARLPSNERFALLP